MVNYTVNGKNYTANDGFVFQSKRTGILSKVLRLKNPEMIENFEIIPEPVPESIPEETEQEVET